MRLEIKKSRVIKKLKLYIDEMHCASCAFNIERNLKKIQGIKEVSISLMLKRGTVEMYDSVNVEEIKNAVSKTGYRISKIE